MRVVYDTVPGNGGNVNCAADTVVIPSVDGTTSIFTATNPSGQFNPTVIQIHLAAGLPISTVETAAMLGAKNKR